MSPFRRFVPIDGAELKAVLLALLLSGLFITLLGVVYQPSRRERVLNYMTVPAPLTPNKLRELEVPPIVAPVATFRVVPENLKHVDFKNHSYGVYALSNGAEIDLTLYRSELLLPDSLGWFALNDVYYKDVTGDGKAEAIVRLSHVKCDGSCDRAADLFYIYTMRNGRLTTIWQYETGSLAYGCGLKSFTVAGKQLVLELFGQCATQATEYPGTMKFVVKDLTFHLFEFNGQRFVKETSEFVPTGPMNVKGYEPAIRLF